MKKVLMSLLTVLMIFASAFCVTSCGKEEGLHYKRSKDRNYYIVTGLGEMEGTVVEIPAMYKGLPVREIGEKAFYFQKDLTQIVIPDGVTKIGDNAFNGCQHVRALNIPNSVTDIGEGAFLGCWNVQKISLPNSVTNIGDSAFAGCWALTEFVVPDGMVSIGKEMLSDCQRLTSVTIGTRVKSIGEKAFVGCPELKEIFIPANVTRFDSYAFSGFFEKIVLENTEGWTVQMPAPYTSNPVAISSADFSDLATAKDYLTRRYSQYIWTCEE